jgi:hypothetical protein
MIIGLSAYGINYLMAFHLSIVWSTRVDDNVWIFGQILPVILLVGPLITMLGFFIQDIKEEENSDREWIPNRYEGQIFYCLDM